MAQPASKKPRTAYSAALSPYAAAFTSERAHSAAFLAFHSKGADGGLRTVRLSRAEVWSMARKAAAVLSKHGLAKGDCAAHYFTANSHLDIAFRLGATMLGSVPVTVNWQADTPERVMYKVTATKAKLLLVDGGVPEATLKLAREVSGLAVLDVAAAIAGAEELPESAMCANLDDTDTRIIIFTSGTTGKPKGVQLTYGSYTCSRATFETFLQVTGEMIAVVANPMHHTNSTAITDWVCRNPTARLELFAVYTTAYWAQLVKLANESATTAATKLICPSVSKHFDFLDALVDSGKLPCSAAELRTALSRPNTHMLLGSAPVGPTTVARLRKHTGEQNALAPPT
jgi:acyl-CoA synthetase (AMP-forming)/AMP-acid ligase II